MLIFITPLIWIITLYRADLYDDDIIMSLIMYKPPWADEYTRVKEGDKGSEIGKCWQQYLLMSVLVQII